MSGDSDSPQQIDLVRMGERDVVPLDKILDSLEFMADNIRKGSCFEEIKDQLKGCKYAWLIGDNPDKWEVMKALAVAVNKAIKEKKIEPVDKKSKKVNEELYHLLEEKTMVSPSTYFRRNVNVDLKITSPRVLAEVCLLSKAKDAQWLVKNMIQRQFDINWETTTGEPYDHSFYDFCDTEKTKKFFKYKPRQAHVKATLYKECRHKQQMLNDLLHKTKNSVRPEVFVNTVDGWKIWQALDEEDEEGKFTLLPKDPDPISSEKFSWIDPSILNFIKKNADIQKPDDNSLNQSLEKPTLYWAVIKDSKFKPGNCLKLKEIGSTQVYVGKANNGIKGRWMKDSGSHCEMMKKCLDNVCAMTTYDPLRLEGIQLVDARLALAKVREKTEKSALFVMKTFGDDLEKAEIAVQKAQKHFDELRESEGLSPFDASENYDSDSDASEESLPATPSEPLRKAWDELQSAKSYLMTLSKDSKKKKYAEVIKQLEDEERYHRHGKQNKSENIILHDKFNMTWEPKHMGYGMNFK